MLIAVLLSLFRDNILHLTLPFLPLDDGKTIAYYQDLFDITIAEFAWAALTLALAYVVSVSQKIQKALLRLKTLAATHHARISIAVIVVFAFISTAIALVAFQEFPNSADEYVYLYQAETLSEGRLWYPASPVEDAFRFNHIGEKDGIRVGRFPPGWPLLMAIFLFTGVPASLVNIILGVLALFIFYRLSLKLYGSGIAVAGVAVMASSAFFVFNAASYFSHLSCVFEALVFVWGVYVYNDRKVPIFALMAGAALGLMIITRYYTAVLLSIPLCAMVMHQTGLKSLRLFFWIAVGALPFFMYLLWYNYSITGEALMPVTVWAYSDEGLGFINGHTIWRGIEHIIRRMLMFAYWVSPVLLVLYFFFIIRKLVSRETRFTRVEDYFFIFLIIGYFFYYEIGGNQYGPRFYFEAFPFLLLLVLRSSFEGQYAWVRVIITAAVVIMFVRLPLIAHREYEIVNERTNLYQLVEQEGLENAVVFVTNGTSVLRPMPASDLTRNDKFYRASVLYAFDDAASNDDVMNRFPERKFYRYIRRDDDPSGKLVEINPKR